MSHTHPPSYAENGVEDLELPAYEGLEAGPPRLGSEPRVFSYQLKNNDGWWAKLDVTGDGRISNAITPSILQGTSVTGSVQLALRKTEPIQAIRVAVRGEILGGIPGEGASDLAVVFLDVKKTLWTSFEGDANAPSTKPFNSGLKLNGDYQWPFSIALPKEIVKKGKTYPLPHSFGTGKGFFTLQYVVEMHIVRPKFRFGRDEKLPVIFKYFVLSQPPVPSPLRAIAYQEGSPLGGPEVDPEGWDTKTFAVSGNVFSSRKVGDIIVKFSLAKPLSYTRSSSIPCALTIESPDTEVVDLLSQPDAPMVYLERTTQQNAQNYHRTLEPCMKATFWTPPGSVRGRLMGEIHLKPDLHPTTDFSEYGLAIQYTVVLFPFQAAGFNQAGKGAFEPIKNSRQAVEICTQFAPGPRPRTYSVVPAPGKARNSLVDTYYRLTAVTSLSLGGM